MIIIKKYPDDMIQTQECNKCGCIFEYSKYTDITTETIYDFDLDYDYYSIPVGTKEYIKCPVCANQMNIVLKKYH